mgnify:CR=1 FL=1
MSRSLKKGPYISVKLDKKVAAMEARSLLSKHGRVHL